MHRASWLWFRGRLVARGSQLRLAIDSLQIGNMRPPPLVLLAVEAALNPLFDVARYPVPARFDSVAVQGDALIVTSSGVNEAALAMPP